jgi:hypothetical protein
MQKTAMYTRHPITPLLHRGRDNYAPASRWRGHVQGKVVVDLRGDVWGFPTTSSAPFPVDLSNNQPFPNHLSRTIRFHRDETPLRFGGSSRGPFRVFQPFG